MTPEREAAIAWCDDLLQALDLEAGERSRLEGIKSFLAALSSSAQLERELAVTDKLLEERNRVLKAIPGCKAHGEQCVPHALEWIAEQLAAPRESKGESAQPVVGIEMIKAACESILCRTGHDLGGEEMRAALQAALHAAPSAIARTPQRETREQLRQRFESWFSMTYPLFREGGGRDTTIKHQLWTAWQVAHLDCAPDRRTS